MTLVDNSPLIASMSVKVCPLPRVTITTRSKPAFVPSSVCPSFDENNHSVSLPVKKKLNLNSQL